MKRTILTVLALLLITACGSSPSSVPPSSPAHEPSSSQASDSSSSSQASDSSSSSTVSVVPPVKVKPILDEELSKGVSTRMLDGFGGMGDPKYADFATSWYRFIDKFEVYKEDDSYYLEVFLTDEVLDVELCRMLSMSVNQDVMDILVPPILDTVAALKLDRLDAVVIGDTLTNMMKGTKGEEMLFYVLLGYEIPVYKYLSESAGVSERTVMDNLKDLYGTAVVAAILDGMDMDFGGSYTGATSKNAETIARAAMAFEDVYLEKAIVMDSTKKRVATFENRIPKK